jgi:hypothetical protein
LLNNKKSPPNNGTILTIATIIKAVMFSTAEAELGALFIKAKEAIHLQQILEEMGHSQPRTPLQTNNTTAEGLINNKIQQKRTKAMDMRYHWGTIQYLLASQWNQLGRLLHEASCPSTSCQYQSRVSHQSQRPCGSQTDCPKRLASG